MSAPQLSSRPSPADDSASPSDRDSIKSQNRTDKKYGDDLAPLPPAALATREEVRMEAAMGDAILRFLRIRRGPKGDQYDLDAVCEDSLGESFILYEQGQTDHGFERSLHNRASGIPSISKSIRSFTSIRTGRT